MGKAAKQFRFDLVIRGENVAPATVRVADLCRLLQACERIVLSLAGAHEVAFSLVGIEKSSNRLVFEVASRERPRLRKLARAIASRRYSSLPRPAWAGLSALSDLISSRGWRLDWEFQSGAAPDASISAECPVPPPPPAIKRRGAATLYGKLVTVGGVSPHALLAQENGRNVRVHLDRELAKKLAQRLYDVVGLEGEAVWTADYEIEEFTAARVLPYRDGSILEAFDALARGAGDAWDNVDARRFVESLRAEAMP